MKKTTLILLGASFVFFGVVYYYHTFNTINSNEVSNNEVARSLPNNLNANEGGLIEVSYAGKKLLFASNISPLLRPGSNASEELLQQGESWDPRLLYQFTGAAKFVLFPGGPLVRLRTETEQVSSNTTKDTLFLDVYNGEDGGFEKSIDYHTSDSVTTIATNSGVESVNISNDFVYDFDVDSKNKRLFIIMDVAGSQGALWGDATSESSAQIIEVDIVSGSAKDLLTIPVEKAALVHADEPDTWLLPTDIDFTGGGLLLTWRQRLDYLSLADNSLINLITLDQQDWDAGRVLTAKTSPNGETAFVIDALRVDYSVPVTSKIYNFNPADLSLTEIGSLPPMISGDQGFWNSDGNELLLASYDEITVNLYQITEDGSVNTFSNTGITAIYGLLSSGKVLVNLNKEIINPDEYPETDDKALVPLYLYDLNTGTAETLGNYRNPFFLGEK